MRTAICLSICGLLFIGAAVVASFLGHVYDVEAANSERMSAVGAHPGGFAQYQIDEEDAAVNASAFPVLLAGPVILAVALVLLIAAFAYKDARRAFAVLVVLSALASIGSLAASKYVMHFVPVSRDTRK